MYHRRYATILTTAFSIILLVSGCATTPNHRTASFPEANDPALLPPIDIAAVAPDAPRPVQELLKDANAELEAANAAQEKGDHEQALRHYTVMLEILIEADLDPSIYYNLRGEFARILDTTTRQAKLFENKPLHEFTAEDYQKMTVVGDLQAPYPLPTRVVREIDRIQKVYPNGFKGGLDRSGQYLPYIRSVFAEKGLPMDLAWLAMCESQYKENALSRAGAAGMWQFMRGTGRRYGLRIDRYIDERYDWRLATDAAARYLTDLRNMFDGEWPLAVSGYNSGERRIEQAVAMNGGDTNLWRLLDTRPASSHIPLETKAFYAKLLATIIVAREPEEYGFNAVAAPPDDCELVPVEGAYALADLEKFAGIPSGTLKDLNPAIRLGITPPEDTYELCVPAGTARNVAEAVSKSQKLTTAQLERIGTYTHTVKRGETLSEIGARYGVSVQQIMSDNKIRSARRVQVGKQLIIRRDGYVAPENTTVASISAGANTYTVRRGDTLYEIAQATNMSVKALQDLNGLGSRSRIYIGQVLKVNSAGSSGGTFAGSTTTHVVKKGEYPGKIAQQYGVKLNDLLAWNNLTKRSRIQIGQELIIRGASTSMASQGQPGGTRRIEHTVVSGDTSSTIAARYGVRTDDFLSWNNMSRDSILHIGDKCVVYAAGDETITVASAEFDTQTSAKKTTHIVKSGQNPTTIARHYGVKISDLFAWNKWDKAPLLRIGDKVIVYTR